VTAVSNSLRDATCRELSVKREIDVVPNFLDCAAWHRIDVDDLRSRYAGPDGATRIVMHLSNFRPVKRIDRVLDIFARIAARVSAVLLLAGDGPDAGMVHRLARQLGIADRVHVLGAQENVVPLLSIADLFLLPSEQESFGLAALEAMACGVPVVASDVGGLPEVIDHGVTGFLHPAGDVDAMAESGIRLLSDRALHRRMADAAAAVVGLRFCSERVVPMYEEHYERVLGG
jgi:N-acetyl-alpha-D-glucosaminyl L-malate synthase BshA